MSDDEVVMEITASTMAKITAQFDKAHTRELYAEQALMNIEAILCGEEIICGTNTE